MTYVSYLLTINSDRATGEHVCPLNQYNNNRLPIPAGFRSPVHRNVTVLPVFADSRAASRIRTTSRLFSSEYSP